MKIVVLDGGAENPGDLSWEGLESLGDLTVYDKTDCNDEQEIVKRIGDAEIVVTNKTPINKSVLEQVGNVKYVGMLSTGYNVVDVEFARTKNIPVCNIPTYGTYAVAQFAIAMLLEICHHVDHHNNEVHKGRWDKDWCFWDYPLIELYGKTMGVIGYGRIGRTTGDIAKALGMKVLAYSPMDKDASLEDENMKYVELDELLQNSDVVSLHCPLFKETEGIINKDSIAKMKDGVIILNNSRGQLIVEQDLAYALNNGKVFAAGLDVVSAEPINPNNPLLSAKNCIITPHISWASKESRKRLMDIAVDNLKYFVDGNPVNVVN